MSTARNHPDRVLVPCSFTLKDVEHKGDPSVVREATEQLLLPGCPVQLEMPRFDHRRHMKPYSLLYALSMPVSWNWCEGHVQ